MAYLTIKHGGFDHQTWWYNSSSDQPCYVDQQRKTPPKDEHFRHELLGSCQRFFFKAMVKVLQPFAVPHVGTHLEGQGMVAMNLEVWR